MKKDIITFRLDTDKKKILDTIALVMDRDRAYVLNEAVDDFIELHQWQMEQIQKGIEEADKGLFASKEDVQKVFQRWKN